MNGAIRWLGDFVRGRTDPWSDRAARGRVLAIAAVICISSLGAVVDEVRNSRVLLAVIYAIWAAAGASLFVRSKAAYIASFVFTLLVTASFSYAAIWLPLFGVLAADTQGGDPLGPELVVYAWEILWLGLFALVAWRYFALYAWLRRTAPAIEPPLLGFAIVGAILLVAWSVAEAIVGTSWVQTWMTNPSYYGAVRIGAAVVSALPIFVYCMWSYVTLRSRAVRDAFDLP